MPFTLTMPKLSPTMEAGTITKWHKKLGDAVKEGEVLFEVTTDKATVEHSALDAGFLREILGKEGQEVRVGQAVAIFSLTKDEDISSYKPEGITVQEEVPEVSGSAEPQQVVQKTVEKPAVLAIPSVFRVEPPLENYAFPFPSGPCSQRTKATPYAKKLAKQQGVDLTTVKGTGPNGRVVGSDLDLAQKQSCISFDRGEVPSVVPGSYEEIPLSPIRKVIATRLQQAKSSIPHFYVAQQVDAEPMVLLREQLKNGGLKVTVNDLVIRATALALREHPEMNSGFNAATESMIRFQTIDIAIAVSVPDGLVTPIIRHADFKNLGQIGAEVRSLAKKAQEGKLQREEYMGGSFTISNLGMFGISEFQGIINPPQAAILCVGGIEEKPVVKNDSLVAGKVMTFCVSADHRVLDGVDVAKFLKTLERLLINPGLLVV